MPPIRNGHVSRNECTLQQFYNNYLSEIHFDSIGQHIGLCRKLKTNYDFNCYVKELTEGKAVDPKSSSKWSIELPIQNMIETSPTLKLVGLSLKITIEYILLYISRLLSYLQYVLKTAKFH